MSPIPPLSPPRIPPHSPSITVTLKCQELLCHAYIKPPQNRVIKNPVPWINILILNFKAQVVTSHEVQPFHISRARLQQIVYA